MTNVAIFTPVPEAGDEKADRFFDSWRAPLGAPAKAVVRQVISSVLLYEETHGSRQRRRKEHVRRSFEATVSAAICDLMHVALTGDSRGIVLSRSHRVLGKADRYRAPALNQQLPRILDMLAKPELGWIVQDTGSRNPFGRGQLTRLHPSLRLVERMAENGVTLADLGRAKGGEVIILKANKRGHNDNGQRVSYEETTATTRMRNQLNAINDGPGLAHIEFDSGVLQSDRAVDPKQRSLRRVFTRSSFTSGGRLFGGFWIDLSKQERLEGLTIEGEPVVALDYGQIGPRTLYGLARTQPPCEDLYAIPGLTEFRGVSYRDGVKKVMNALTFREGIPIRKPKGTLNLLPHWLRMEQVVDLIKQAHPAIASYFGTDVGHYVQFVESEVMVDVVTELMARGVVALPVHDCVLVPESAEELARATMVSVFERHTGVSIIVGSD